MVGLGTRIFESSTSCSDYRLSLEYKRMNKQILCISLPLFAFKATFSKAWSFRSISGPPRPSAEKEPRAAWYTLRHCLGRFGTSLHEAHCPDTQPRTPPHARAFPEARREPCRAHVARPMMQTCIMRMHESWVQIQPSASSVTLA